MVWKFDNIAHCALVWICLVGSYTTSQDPFFVFDEIYDAEHFWDVLLSTNSDVTIRHAVLILYTPACQTQVDFWRLLHNALILPDDNYMFFGVHDYETSEKYTWYNWGPDENLTSWFKVKPVCAQPVYLSKGSTKNTEPIMLRDKTEFLSWTWEQVKVKITLINEASEDVIFSFRGSYMPISGVTVSPGRMQTVDAFTSYVVCATGNRGFYGGWVVGYTAKTLIAHTATTKMDVLRFVFEKYHTMARRREHLGKEVWDYADRHLLNRKQPLMLPNFTTTGYQRLFMPKWLETLITEFYLEKREQSHAESWEPGMTGINMDRRRCGMVEVDNATKHIIIAGLHPLLEKWCKCKLTVTSFYGIREYYKGHRLKKHVNRIGTHIISVILQVVQDLNGGPDWELEVINYKGKRKQVQLKAGEMLFYESARLIHGRPNVFQGQVMADAFVHFKPTTGWLYERLSDGKLYYNGKNLVNVYPLSDAKTLSALQAKDHGIVDHRNNEL